jgi:serine/threonine protein kinase
VYKYKHLEKLIKKRWEDGKKFTDEEIATIMGALFKGVNHIHSVSIIHRDIKPGTPNYI